MIPKEIYEVQKKFHEFPYQNYNEDAPEPPEFTALVKEAEECTRLLVEKGYDEDDIRWMFVIAEDEFRANDKDCEEELREYLEELKGMDLEGGEVPPFDETLQKQLQDVNWSKRSLDLVDQKLKKMSVVCNDVPLLRGNSRRLAKKGKRMVNTRLKAAKTKIGRW